MKLLAEDETGQLFPNPHTAKIDDVSTNQALASSLLWLRAC
jgi:hypothetical protein